MSNYSVRSSNPILSFIIIAAILLGLFYVAKGVFWVLTWAAPVLLIATLVINHQVVLSYLQMLWTQLKTTPFFGIIAIVLSFFAFPVVIFYLFGKALLLKRVEKFQQNFESRYQNPFQNIPPSEQYERKDTGKNDSFTPYEEVK